MKTEIFVRRSRISASAEEVFAWHNSPGAFARLNPPWEPVEVVERTGSIRDGDRMVMRVRVGPFHRLWVALHRDFRQDRQFRDIQIEGPFARWDHLHRIEPDGPDACFLEDRIEYALPLGVLGRFLVRNLVRRKLEMTFAYRHRTTIQDLENRHKQQGFRTMNILISGSTGLVGSALVPLLTAGGHRVIRLVRSAGKTDGSTVVWNPDQGVLDSSALEGLDAVIHLAGESIAEGRWTAEKKARIRDSRVKGTRLLSETLARLKKPPRILLSASAIGYYGSRGDEILTEESSAGSGFLVDVCREWEGATRVAEEHGIGVAHLRFGVILSAAGGALAKMLFPFKMGGGGKLGNGCQFFSWIALDDVLGSMDHILNNESLRGAVNIVAPHSVTNLEFTKTLGRVLHRPTIVPMPAFAARLVFGEMADELLLSSARVEPAKLLANGYTFRYPNVEGAIRHLLGKSA